MLSGVLGYTGLGSFELGDGSVTPSLMQTVTQTLTFDQTVSPHETFDESIIQTLSLSQTAVPNGDLNVNVTQTLAFTQDVDYPRIINDTIIQNFNASQSVGAVVILAGGGALSIVQTFVSLSQSVSYLVERARILSQTMDFTHQAIYIAIRPRSISQTFTMHQVVSYNVDRNLSVTQSIKFRNGFASPLPIVSQGSGGLQSQQFFYGPSVVGVIVNSRNRFVALQVPAQTVVLRTPQLNDSQNVNSAIDLKKTMTGTVFTYVKNSQFSTLKYTFFLGRQKSLELEGFLETYCNQVMALTNWKGEIWIGNIINNPFEFTANARYLKESERVDVSLEFSGVLITGQAGSPCGA